MKKMTHHRLLGIMSSASGTAAFVCAALLFSARVATAEPRLERPISDAIFIVGATCLDRNELARDLAARLGRDEIDRGIHVFVIETREEGLAFFITTATSIAPRVLPINPGEPCKDRRTAIAIALEDALRHAVLTQEKQPQQAPIKLPQPAPAALARAAPPVPPRDPIKISVTLRGLALFGVFPAAAGGIEASVAIRTSRSFELQASGFSTTAVSVPLSVVGAVLPDSARMNLSLAGGRLDGCAVAPFRALQVLGCLGIAAGRFTLAGEGFRGARSSSVAWLAPTTRLGGRWSPVDWLGFEVGFLGAAPLLRPQANLEIRGQVVPVSSSIAPLAVSVDAGVKIIWVQIPLCYGVPNSCMTGSA